VALGGNAFAEGNDIVIAAHFLGEGGADGIVKGQGGHEKSSGVDITDQIVRGGENWKWRSLGEGTGGVDARRHPVD